MKDILFPDSQLEKKFKHSGKFDPSLKDAKCNRGNSKRFHKILKEHMRNPRTKRIRGFYRGLEAVHYYNPDTRLNVMINPLTKRFISGWELSPNQKFHLRKNRNIS